jgi:hypothetical protein
MVVHNRWDSATGVASYKLQNFFNGLKDQKPGIFPPG